MGNLIEVTALDCTENVYIPDIGVKFHDLTDDEKFQVYRSVLYMRNLYQKKLQDQSEVISDVLKRVLKIPRMPKAAMEILNQIACDDDDDELNEW